MYYHPSRISFAVASCCCILMLLPAIAVAQIANCSALPPHTPASIRDLRPGDIKAVMAMGDSITTGFGVRGTANESYGVSFSMGGDAGAITLANFLAQFSTNLTGFSTGASAAEVCYGTNCPAARYYAQDNYNAAKSGAMAVDLGKQVSYLITQVNVDPNVNVQTDWKVLTIMIGMNDLCASCTFNLPYLSPDDYQLNLMSTLERVRTNLPRTFVNLVAGFNVSQAYDLSLQTSRCQNISRPVFIECDCLFQPENGFIRETIDASITEFNARAQFVASYYQHKAYDNFAVVFQPFAMDTHISELPTNFLSHLDCFHPSKSGMQAMAIALWNNMLTPSISKKTSIDLKDTPICPTEDTLLYTY